MKRLSFICYLFFTFFLFMNHCLAENHETQPREISPLYQGLSKAIVRLYLIKYSFIKEEKGYYQEDQSQGTAFFVKRGSPLFIVTARHVVEINSDLYAKVLTTDKNTGEDKIKYLELPRRRWQFHPNNGDKETRPVDVAAMKIPWPKDERHNVELDQFAYNPSDEKGYLKDPSPPEDVFIFGFPGDIGFRLEKQRPFGRKGLVAMLAEKKFIGYDNKYANEKTYIIDTKIFPGNSGSPVFKILPIEPYIFPAGLIVATNPNMDYAIAETGSRIGEIINIANEQDIGKFIYWSDNPPTLEKKVLSP